MSSARQSEMGRLGTINVYQSSIIAMHCIYDARFIPTGVEMNLSLPDPGSPLRSPLRLLCLVDFL